MPACEIFHLLFRTFPPRLPVKPAPSVRLDQVIIKMRLSASCQRINSLHDNESFTHAAITGKSYPSQSAGYCLLPLTFDERQEAEPIRIFIYEGR